MSSKCQSAQFRTLRTIMFSSAALLSSLPLFTRLYYPIVEFHTYRYLFSLGLIGVGAFIYAARWPERYHPKTFDIIGSSHQLFHVIVVLGGLGMSWCGMSMYFASLSYECVRDPHGLVEPLAGSG